MNARKALVLDANILIRAVLGERVLRLLEQYEQSCDFCSPDVCFAEARKHLPGLLQKRGADVSLGLLVLERIRQIVQPIDPSLYEEYEIPARAIIGQRDPNDWAVLATAMALKCAIWTEDRDFWGAGVPVWITQTVEMYLKPSSN
jgi:predicted nucleic acid-binding protein